MKGPRIRTKLTRSGTIFAVLTLLIGVAAVNTGNNLLYIVLSIMLAIMGVSGFMAYINIKALEVKMAFPDELYARTPALIRVTVSNKKFLPSFLIAGKFRSKNGCVANWIHFSIPNHGDSNRWLSVSFPKRGIDRIEFIELSTTYPFGFTTRFINLPLKAEVLVYPHIRPIKIDRFWAEENGMVEGSRKEGSDGDFMGLRAYRPGDSPRKIFWKGYAKTRKLLVKQFTEHEGNRVLIQLQDRPDEDEIETAASIAVAHLRVGGYVALQIGDRRIPFGTGEGHKRLILRELALL